MRPHALDPPKKPFQARPNGFLHLLRRMPSSKDTIQSSTLTGGSSRTATLTRAPPAEPTPPQVKVLAYVFESFDLNGDGSIDREEMQMLLHDMGYPCSEVCPGEALLRAGKGGEG